MDSHTKKMIAPIVITFIFLAYLAIWLAVFFVITDNVLPKLLLTIPLLALGTGMVYTLLSRINEIRNGEEDDFDNY